MSLFPEVKVGDTPTLLDADFANRLIRFINAIASAKVSPAGVGRFVVTEQSFALDMSPQKATSQSGAPDLANVQAQVAALQGQVAALITSLRNATISASCDPVTGEITITIAFPNLPG